MNRKIAFLICSTVLISTDISILTKIHADENQSVNTSKIVDGKEESFTDETIESNADNTSVICNQNGVQLPSAGINCIKVVIQTLKMVKMQLYIQRVLLSLRLLILIYRAHPKEAVVLLQVKKQWYMQMIAPF